MSWNKDFWVKDAIFAGYLRVDQDGRVYRNLNWGKEGGPVWRELQQRTHQASGRVYFQMSWRKHPRSTEFIRKSVLTNRAVALRYLPNPLNLPQVNHIDGVKAHNYLRQPTAALRAQYGEYQLEWSTGHDNEKHAHANGLKTGRGSQNANARLTAAQVLEIRASADTKSPDELAALYGVGKTTIVNVISRKTWLHI